MIVIDISREGFLNGHGHIFISETGIQGLLSEDKNNNFWNGCVLCLSFEISLLGFVFYIPDGVDGKG